MVLEVVRAERGDEDARINFLLSGVADDAGVRVLGFGYLVVCTVDFQLRRQLRFIPGHCLDQCHFSGELPVL